MITIVNVLAGIAIASGAVLAALLVRRAFRKDRAHGRRIARYRTLSALTDLSRDDIDGPEWERVRQALRAADEDLRPEDDPCITEKPRSEEDR